MLAKLKCLDFPNMKDKARNKFHKSIYKKAFPNQKEKVLNTEEAFKMLLG
jgi:hypothetical protein